jgi:hypothetical protein
MFALETKQALVLLPQTDARPRITLVPPTTVTRFTGKAKGLGDDDEPVKLKRLPREYNPATNWFGFFSLLGVVTSASRSGKNTILSAQLDRAVKKLPVHVDVLRNFIFPTVCVRSVACSHLSLSE